MATQRILLPTVTSIPATLGTLFADIKLGNGVDIRVQASGGVGNAQLLMWTPAANSGAGAWYPYGFPDTTMALDATKFLGRATFRYVINKDAYGKYLLLLPAGVTVSDSTIEGIDL